LPSPPSPEQQQLPIGPHRPTDDNNNSIAIATGLISNETDQQQQQEETVDEHFARPTRHRVAEADEEEVESHFAVNQ
jgi:hypothetical protein